MGEFSIFAKRTWSASQRLLLPFLRSYAANQRGNILTA